MPQLLLNNFAILNIKEYTESDSEPFDAPVCFVSVAHAK